MGTGGADSSGVINFNGTAFPSTPFCTVSTRLASVGLRIATATTTLTIVTHGAVAMTVGDTLSWICISAK